MSYSPHYQGLSRRNYLQLGLGSLFGGGLVNALRVRGQASEQDATEPVTATSCILIWMDGGPTHFETFDPKPDAPSKINFGVKAIRTKSSDLIFSDFPSTP